MALSQKPEVLASTIYLTVRCKVLGVGGFRVFRVLVVLGS